MKFDEIKEALQEIKKLTTVNSKNEKEKTIYYKPQITNTIKLLVVGDCEYVICTDDIYLMSLSIRGLHVQYKDNVSRKFLSLKCNEILDVIVEK